MTVSDFLHAIFPGSTAGYACLVEVPTHPTKTYKERWNTSKSTYQAVREGLPLNINADELNATSDWFFSPSVYADRQRIRQNAESAKVLWVDFDKPYEVDPLKLPIHPSMVVETSPGKYHCYWLLTENLSATNVEYLNRNLTYHFGADLSGWDAVQILRLPAGRHSKDPNAIFQPHLLFIDINLLYTPADFESIPEANDPKTALTGVDAPIPTIRQTHEAILRKYKDQLSWTVMEAYKHVESDRSRALWFLAHAAYRADMTLEEAYWWLLGSANDKFSELRRGGEEALWRDVQAGFAHAAETRSDQSVIANISAVLAAKASPLDKKQKITEYVLQDMQKHGKLFNTKDTGSGYYLQRDLTSGSAETIQVDPKQVYFQKLMLKSYSLNATTEEFRYVTSDIYVNCFNTPPVDLHRMSHFDRTRGLLYINRYDGTSYLLDGHSIEVVPNGYRDVFFTNPPSVEPLPTGAELGLQDEDDGTPRSTELWYNLIFPSDNLAKQSNSYPDDLKLILMSWVTSIYFKELINVKPIMFMHGPPGSGKCLGENTPVMLASGAVIPVQDVRVGDVLMGPGGARRTVLSTNRGTGPLYRITPTKGASWVCNDVHMMTTVNTDTGLVSDTPLNVLLSKRGREREKLVRSPVDFPIVKTALDPYFMGVWLGDGSFDSPTISTPDQEVLDYCREYARSLGMVATDVKVAPGKCPQIRMTANGQAGRGYHSNPIWNALQDARDCSGKSIPPEYLYNGKEERYALLAGLLDTDGYTNRGSYEITTKYPKLADQIVFLARSLGFAAYQTPKTGRIASTGFEGQYVRISISGHLDRIPCKVPRKQSKPRRQIKNVLRTGWAAEPTGVGDYYGFTLDGDGRFLLGDFTVTHNTMTFKALGYTVFGPLWSPYETPSKEETFNHTVAMSDLNVYDNIDSYVSWLPDKLAQASTSYIFSKRKLYSNGDDYRVHISCFIGLTAFAPKFRRVDVMERMIPVRVVPFSTKLANESIITNRIVKHRRELWRELLGLLSAILRRLATMENTLPNTEEGMRIGDYLSMLNLVAAETGQDPSRAASTIRFGQAKEMTEDDPLIYALEKWLSFPKNQDRGVTWEELYMELCALSNVGEEIRRKVTTPRGMFTKLGQLSGSMAHAGITFVTGKDKRHTFTRVSTEMFE